MYKATNIIIATKCLPDQKVFSNIERAGLKAVELYLSNDTLINPKRIIKLCKVSPFRYSLHAPRDEFKISNLKELAEAIDAEIIVFHDIYWEDEWKNIIKLFGNVKAKLCVENIYSVHEPLKFMRRFSLGMCLDLEHLQMQCAGIYEEEFIRIINLASHIHLTGYIYGSQLWHTHIHHSLEHNLYIFNLLKKAKYSGFVVSEAKSSLQTYKEFKRLSDFFKIWETDNNYSYI